MAIQALQSAIDLFSAEAPALSGFLEAEREYMDLAKQQDEELTQMLRDRKIHAVRQKTDISESFKNLAAEGPSSIENGLAQLDTVILDFDRMITLKRKGIEERRAAFDRETARLAAQSVETARRIRKQNNRFFELTGEFYNETVEFYYFLLALRAEYDPDAKDGKSFDDPEALGAYLREQIKA